MKKVIDWVTIKFLIVGVINTLVGTSVMFVCYNVFHTGYWIASAMNYIIGSIPGCMSRTSQERKRSASGDF